MLKIGVSACFLQPDHNRRVFSKKTLLYLEHEMSLHLLEQQVIPILIPEIADESVRTRFLSELDGLVLQGGDDIAPETYGETPLRPEWAGDRRRDIYELAIVKAMFAQRKPILGVCRGHQLLNVFFGGALYQDIKAARPDALQHRDGDRYDQLSHPIAFAAGSWFEQLYQHDQRRVVNSIHHQAIKTLGKGLSVEATCPMDGIIEAIAYVGTGTSPEKAERFIVGVQWHPEFATTLRDQVIDTQPLLERFLIRCRQSG